MEPPTKGYICRTCLVALDWHEIDGWVHPLQQILYVDGVQDHMPDPIPHDSALEHRYRCDFCFGHDPTWTYPCDSFEYEGADNGETGYRGSYGDWGACDRCHDLIERRDITALLSHWRKSPSAAGIARADLPGVELAVMKTWRGFLNHRSGPAYRDMGDTPP